MRTPGEVIKMFERHLATAEEDRTQRILRRKLGNLGWQKVDPIDYVTVGQGTDTPDKPLKIREKLFCTGRDSLWRSVPLPSWSYLTFTHKSEK